MIGTIDTKQQQLRNGYYKIGSGKELVLIMGSCRAIPYLNYLNEWNNENNNRFTLAFIDPFNWNWDINDNRVDYSEALTQMEKNESLLSMLRSCSVFIHEYYANAGMFNVEKSAMKNIYQFGMSAPVDVCIPNFNDIFILTREIVSFDVDIKKKAVQDYNVIGRLSDRTLIDIDKVRQDNLERFFNICSKTDFPEFAEIFSNNYKNERYFWTFNHVATAFTYEIFKLLTKFLKIDISPALKRYILSHDMYANNYTYLCEYDKGYSYNEQTKPLREIL